MMIEVERFWRHFVPRWVRCGLLGLAVSAGSSSSGYAATNTVNVGDEPMDLAYDTSSGTPTLYVTLNSRNALAVLNPVTLAPSDFSVTSLALTIRTRPSRSVCATITSRCDAE